MKRPHRTAFRAYRLFPRACVHEEAGSPHATRSDLVECVLANGAPGFRVLEEPLDEKEKQRRLRWRRRARLVDAFGGYCGAGAAPGAGCGIDGGTQLQFAHRIPTALKGMSRGSNERLTDVERHPESYMLLCPECHRRYDKREDGCD